MRLSAAMSKNTNVARLRGCEVARLRVKKVLREVPLPPPLAFSAISYRTHSYLLWHSQLSPLAFSAISFRHSQQSPQTLFGVLRCLQLTYFRNLSKESTRNSRKRMKWITPPKGVPA